MLNIRFVQALPGSVDIPINMNLKNKQTNKQKLPFGGKGTHKRAHAPHTHRLHINLCCSPQSLPSCPGSAVTTGTERRWHPGPLSPRSAWKRSSIASGPSVSGTRCRGLSSSCTPPASTRTVSDLHLWSPSQLLTHRRESARQREIDLFLDFLESKAQKAFGRSCFLCDLS